MIVKTNLLFPLSDRTATLKSQYSTSIQWSSPPSFVCLNNVANQMKGYMNMAFTNTSNSADCSQVYRWIDVKALEDQISLEISLVPFKWNRTRAENCLMQLWLFSLNLFKARFIQDLSNTCQVLLNPDLHGNGIHTYYECNPDYHWNSSTKNCVLGIYYVLKDYFSTPELTHFDLKVKLNLIFDIMYRRCFELNFWTKFQ